MCLAVVCVEDGFSQIQSHMCIVLHSWTLLIQEKGLAMQQG